MLNKVQAQLKNTLPHTSSALDHRTLQVICNDILINNRRFLVELGSGYSTIIISKFISMNNLDCKVISIEENEQWAKLVSDLLEKESLDEIAKIECLKVKDSWYVEDELDLIMKNQEIQVLIIDGPNAGNKEDIRSEAMNYFDGKISTNALVVIDDVHRKAEYAMLNNWYKKGGMKKVVDNNTGYLLKGTYFNIF